MAVLRACVTMWLFWCHRWLFLLISYIAFTAFFTKWQHQWSDFSLVYCNCRWRKHCWGWRCNKFMILLPSCNSCFCCSFSLSPDNFCSGSVHTAVKFKIWSIGYELKCYTWFCVQAVLALAASWTSRQVGERTLTGTVIDSGDGVTHVIPVVSRDQHLMT